MGLETIAKQDEAWLWCVNYWDKRLIIPNVKGSPRRFDRLNRILLVPVSWLIITVLTAVTIVLAYQVPYVYAYSLDNCSDTALKSGLESGGKLGASSYCWTSNQANLSFPAVGRNQNLQLTLRLSSGRPAGTKMPSLDVRANGNPVASFPVASEWATYNVILKPELVAADSDLHLQLQMPTFKPSNLYPGNPDKRKLGVIVAAIELRQLAATSAAPVLPPASYGVMWLLAGLLSCAILLRLPFTRFRAAMVLAVFIVQLVLAASLIYARVQSALFATDVLIGLAILWFMVNQIPEWLWERPGAPLRFFYSLGIEDSRARTVVEAFLIILIGVQFFITRVWALRSHSLFDFISYFATVRVWLSGGDFYNTQVLDQYLTTHKLLNGEVPFVYPPTAVLMLSPLALFNLVDAKTIWLLANMGWLIAAGVFLMLAVRRGTGGWISPIWFVLLAVSRPSGAVIGSGQVGLLILFLFALGLWAWSSDHFITAGIAVAFAAAIKVFPALLVGYFLYRRNWRAVIASMITGFVLFLTTLPTVGLDAWWRFLSEGLPSWPIFPNDLLDQSLSGFVRRFILTYGTLTQLTDPRDPGGNYLRVGATLVGLAFIVLTLWWFERHSSSAALPRQVEYGIVVALMLLLLPQVWEHYLTWLIVPIILIIGALTNHVVSHRSQITLVVALSLVAICLEYGPLVYAWSGFPRWLMAFGLLALLLVFFSSLYLLAQLAPRAEEAGQQAGAHSQQNTMAVPTHQNTREQPAK